MRHMERGLTMIDKDDTNRSAVIAVDRPGCVHHADPVLEGEAGSRPDLHFKPVWYRHPKPCRYQRTLSRLRDHAFALRRGKVRPNIRASRAISLVPG